MGGRLNVRGTFGWWVGYALVITLTTFAHSRGALTNKIRPSVSKSTGEENTLQKVK
jgi:hypothetical protein